jgi:uncharacterized protein
MKAAVHPTLAPSDGVLAPEPSLTPGMPDAPELARVLAASHLDASCSPAIAEAASPAKIARRWHDALEVMDGFAGTLLKSGQLAAVRYLADEYLAGRIALFRLRMTTDRIVATDGRLIAGQAFPVGDGTPRLAGIDAGNRSRAYDVLAELASAALVYERLGAGSRVDLLRREYAGHTADDAPNSLFHHYMAQSAVVGCAAACLQYEQGDASAGRSARELLDIAVEHCRMGRIVMAIVGGPPGAGKSTVASSIGAALGWTVIRSDEVRRDMLGGAPGAGSSEWLSEHFSIAATERTYDAMLHRAGIRLGLGDSVILDATWAAAAQRAAAVERASATHSVLVSLRCDVPALTAETRVGHRIAAGRDISMATVAVARQIASTFEPWPGATRVDTALSPPETLAGVLETLRVATTPLPLRRNRAAP